GIPIMSELEERCVAAGGETRLDQRPVLRGGKKHVGVTSLFVGAAADLDEPELVAEELERSIEIANPQHGMKISHDRPFGLGGTCSASLAGAGLKFKSPGKAREQPGIWRQRVSYMIAADIETGIARLRDLVEDADVVLPFTGAGISTECGIPDFRSPGG